MPNVDSRKAILISFFVGLKLNVLYYIDCCDNNGILYLQREDDSLEMIPKLLEEREQIR